MPVPYRLATINQRREPASDQLAAPTEGDAGAGRIASLAACGERRLMQEELLEGEALARPLGLGEVAGEVRRGQRIAGAGEAPPGSKLGWQRLRGMARERHDLPRPLAHSLGSEALGGGMDRDDPGRVKPRGQRGGALRAQELVGLDPQPRAVELPVQEQPRSLAQAFDEPSMFQT